MIHVAEVDLSKEGRQTQYLYDLLFVVGEVGLRFGTLILNCHFVIKFSCQLLTSKGP